jgi:DeoR/GlpR family transcriptional regulator of sugar metabolism
MDSITEKRQAEIVGELRCGHRLMGADLSRGFWVSEVSIRRDMSDLEARGLLRCIHGGAVPVENGRTPVGRAGLPGPQIWVASAGPRLS